MHNGFFISPQTERFGRNLAPISRVLGLGPWADNQFDRLSVWSEHTLSGVKTKAPVPPACVLYSFGLLKQSSEEVQNFPKSFSSLTFQVLLSKQTFQNILIFTLQNHKHCGVYHPKKSFILIY